MKSISLFYKNLSYLKVVLLFIGVFTIANVNAQVKTESVEFKVTTSSPGGSFSPKNIGAIWVEDASGNFVRSLKVWAERRKQYLYTWNSSTGGNTVDATTGATLSSHQSHSVSWNLKDVNGNDAPNGNYMMKIELTDKHAQGPLASFNFPVGEPTNSISFSDESNFHDIQLSWTSVTTSVENEASRQLSYELYQNYPNPFNPATEIKYSLAHDAQVDLSIYNSFGQKLATLVNQHKQAGLYTVDFDASELTSGVYFYKISTPSFSQTKKMLLVR